MTLDTGPTLKQQTYTSMIFLHFDSVYASIADGGPTLSQHNRIYNMSCVNWDL